METNVLQFGAQAPDFERRRHLRSPVPHLSALAQAGSLQILNMSRRGLAIETRCPFAVGGSYLFELCDGGRSLVVEGYVEWVHRAVVPPQGRAEDQPVYRAGLSIIRVHARESRVNVRHLSPAPISSAENRAETEEDSLTGETIGRLQTAESVDEAAELLLDLLSRDFERLVLLRVTGDEVRAWLGRGPTLVPERLKHLRLSLGQPSIFLHLREGGNFFFGPLPPMFAHLQLVRCWEGELHQECAIYPIRINQRLISFVYADAGGSAITRLLLEQLNTACVLFTTALVNQILRRKASVSGSSG